MAIGVGIGGAAAVRHWPSHALPFQMTVFSVMSVCPLIFGLWPERNQRRFKIGLLIILFVHALFLLEIKSFFPFKTILVVIPIALVESVLLFIIMLKALRKF